MALVSVTCSTPKNVKTIIAKVLLQRRVEVTSYYNTFVSTLRAPLTVLQKRDI